MRRFPKPSVYLVHLESLEIEEKKLREEIISVMREAEVKQIWFLGSYSSQALAWAVGSDT